MMSIIVNISAMLLGLTNRFLPLFSWPVLLAVGLGSILGQIFFPVILSGLTDSNAQDEKEKKG